MLRLLRPTLITLTLALPATSYALGLGDIHVQSALHEPLVAQIELVGVVDDELGRVTATLASDELFQKYNLERAPFIYGTTLSVGRDAQGRPVLNMRSTEKFTEPVVTLLVDMHSSSGELVREYTLFLDPAGLSTNAAAESNSSPSAIASTAGVASNAPLSSNSRLTSNDVVASNAGPAPMTERPGRAAFEPPATAASAHVSSALAPAAAGAGSKLLGTKYTVARRDTLARIVTATGARSRTDRHRMMIAIYRANPAAFQNNFNRMHTGVTLTFPTADQVGAISVDETNREYDTQMAQWRGSLHHVANTAAAPATSGSTAAKAAAAAIAANNAREGGAPKGETLPTEHAVLTQRIASLEQSLAQIQQELKRPLPAQTPATAAAASTGSRAPASASAPASAPRESTSIDAAPAVNRATAPSHENASGSSAPAALAAAGEAHSAASQGAAVRVTNARPAPVAAAPAVDDESTSDDDEDDAPPVKHRGYQLIAIGAAASILFFAGTWLYLRRRNHAYHMTPRYPVSVATATTATEKHATEDASSDEVEFSTPPPPPKASEPVAAQEQPPATPKDPKSAASWFEDSFSTPIADLLNDPTVSLGIEDTAKLEFETIEQTAQLPKPTPEQALDTEVLVAPELEFAGDTVEQKFSFFNPEATTNTEHVVMGDGLTESKPFVERRKNPADVLRQAIEKEPHRSDLRLKLLELYYTAAAENRRAFLEATRQLAKNESLATPEDWSRIADMGRIIAPDDKLFCGDSEVDDQRVA